MTSKQRAYLMAEASTMNAIFQIGKASLTPEIISALDEALENIISKNYICNSSIPVKVTRLGQYELINRSFDKYNNMFPSKYDNKIDVTAAPIPMDIYTSYKNSYNEEKFYKFNIDGSLQTPEQLNDILDKCENKTKSKRNIR